MRIVVLDGYTLNPGDLSWAGLEQYGTVEVYDRTAPGEVIDRIGDAEIVFTNKTPITQKILEACPSVRFIGVLATGYNVVDTKAAKDKGIPVCNIPTYGTDAVAQYAFALILELCHHVGEHNRSVKQGDWAACPDFCYSNYPLIELAGKTLGIIGYGRIGRRTAQIARAFGMKVVAFDEYPGENNEEVALVSLDELFGCSDVISLHCPLFPSTEGMICKENLNKMKDGVLLINTSRGPLVKEEDLAQALHSGKVAGAAVDVVSTEPISPDNVLLREENCLITPHIAWAPKESRQRLMDIAVRNLGAFLDGDPENVVNT
ncbi:Glycerate dehydrogenase [uncultured Ruminococcus sp.]|uniref:D-2-hydroxyacid dehydrogenase n=1 Tax=Massiliimalia timonensis TaxID=1987501 RepID=A0A8J6PC93_9FIRM|nr:D-2-hydroxyacid dehydrogenase [Massiliimalia timonensis]MBC8609781.1 D-2-hydroxyacid dehydrogenase [Massiliimalia timonensis]SCH25794.1 Glycerate dehydrogenase [uncultured Ruminococcus sp.]SCH30341.1 Glycerate dehydrogenase [uncultured Clostridium sp.]